MGTVSFRKTRSSTYDLFNFINSSEVCFSTIKALTSIEASALSLGAAAEPKGHSSQGSAPSPRLWWSQVILKEMVFGLPKNPTMLARKFANQPCLTQQKWANLHIAVGFHVEFLGGTSIHIHNFTEPTHLNAPLPFTRNRHLQALRCLCQGPLCPGMDRLSVFEISYGLVRVFCFEPL